METTACHDCNTVDWAIKLSYCKTPKISDTRKNYSNFKVMKLSFITLNYAREVSFYGVIGVARICHMIVWVRAGNQIQ